ncbi:MAG TPA: phosphopentomutase, partial [Firmicutes bacterium]|nr:phosphopentomutase [Bacillota bacterium]
MIDRVFLIVLDGVGIGELPDAQRYGDIGSDTIRNTARAVGGLNLPVLESFGLGCLGDIEGVPCAANPVASYGRMAERSPGKDTTTGHWEIAGLILDQPFPVYPKGFPEDLLAKFTSVIGREIIGNEVASGTEIIMRLGDEHVKTGKPIVYTSADSVFQIAAHEDVITVDELYKISAMARALLTG